MSIVDQLKLATESVPLSFPGEWYVAQSITSERIRVTRIRVTLVTQVVLDGSTIIGYESHLEKTEREWESYFGNPGYVDTALLTIPLTLETWVKEAADAKQLITASWWIDGEEYPGKLYTFDTIEYAP